MSRSVVLGICLGAGAAAYLGLAWYVWRHRAVPGGRALAVLLASVCLWSLLYAFELSAHTIASARMWSDLKFVGIVAMAPAFWAFAVTYTGRAERVRTRTLLWLSVEPVVVLILLAVPQTGSLIHTFPTEPAASVYLSQVPAAGAGPLFWPHAAYTYAVIVTAMYLLVSRLARIASPYRRQANALIVAALAPLAGNFSYNLDPRVTSEVDPTPFLFAVTAVVLVWGFLRLHLLGLVPVARGVVLEQMLDAVLVLDVNGRIVDANPAGARLLGLSRGDVVGRPVSTLLEPVARLLDRHVPGGTTREDLRLPADRDRAAMDLAASLTSLTDRSGAEAGRLLVLGDVTERMATQRRLRELLEEQTHLATALATSLRPATLPQVPGLRLAARSVPAGSGAQVSGDFYDVHPTTNGEWAFVLGDVSGKGVGAAVVTSMARYTVRTLSAQGWAPAPLLQQLNDALLDPDEPERFCTVLYGRTTPLTREGAPGGVRVTLASGGHPPPLLRLRDGEVSRAACSGTALGLLPSIRIGQVVVDLDPGDVLLAYTDGVTEARRGGEEFGESRLARALSSAALGLRGYVGPGAAELVADTVADLIVRVVTEFADKRDDLAVLVLVAA